ncbi:Ger(x)C family spore germination protein [Paenibacillus sp. Lou8.1]|uniref:Ger(x)C family spore germination protein n=1 Tax=Paenibacillus sp. Lou8.1 TaxID=2962041 RepID=UPI000FA93AEE|nr:Ger(x)C family spore germination protein [Paenibacillus sp. Lou8.1]MCP3810296.1 Ger(x)C family spore germination protein [Paenibacillus sp. Lou8.1]
MRSYIFLFRRTLWVQKCITVWIACALLIGCWDSKEIDKLSIIQGVAIDMDQDMLELTYQHLIAQKSKKSMYSNVTTFNKDSIQSASREQAKQVSHAPLYSFIRLILISDQAIQKTRIDQLLDTFTRSYKPSRKSLVMITKGSAKEAFNKMGKHQDIPTIDLEALAKNSDLNSEIPQEITLGEISTHTSQDADFIIQCIETNGGNHFSGAALVRGKTKKFANWIDEKEVTGINWMLGKTKGSIIRTEGPKSEQSMVFEVEDVHTKLIPHLNGQDLSFTVRIKADIKLNESSDNSVDFLKESFIQTAKEAAQDEIKQTVSLSLNTLQKEMRADVVGFGTKVKVNYPAYWDRVKENWQDTFSQIPIDVQAKVQIERTGAYTKGEGA